MQKVRNILDLLEVLFLSLQQFLNSGLMYSKPKSLKISCSVLAGIIKL